MKKKILSVVLVLSVAVGLAACSSGVKSGEVDNGVPKIYGSDVYEFIDADTGVHYWIYSHDDGYGGMGGMTPRLNSDGTVMITK